MGDSQTQKSDRTGRGWAQCTWQTAVLLCAEIVAAYMDTTKYSYGLYTLCACACTVVHTRMHVCVVMACIFMACIVTGCIGTVHAVAASIVTAKYSYNLYSYGQT